VVVVVLALAVGGAFAAGVFSSDGTGGGGGPEELEASNNVKLEAGEIKVFWPGLGPGTASPDLANQVMGVIGRYVDDAIVPGLRTGTVKTASLVDTFDDAALAQLEDPATRETLLDEKLPKAIGELTITSEPIAIVALNDLDNKTVLATARILIKTLVQSEQGWYETEHDGQLVVGPQLDGTWKITAWDAETSRTPPGPKPKPKAKAQPGATSTQPGANSTTEAT
jgi:hypothetical protein